MNIDIRDLRSGNIVAVNYNIARLKIEFGYVPSFNDAYYKGTDGYRSLKKSDLVQPVPITPELLEYWGFDNVARHSSYLDNFKWEKFIESEDRVYVDIRDKVVKIFDCNSEIIAIRKNMQYAHQLQNIVRSMTGVDLGVS